jgi:hypothetical protein
VRLADLEERYPGIPWREPLTATVVPETNRERWEGFACRVCIAEKGLRGADVLAGQSDAAFETEEEFRAHFAARHAG